MCSKDCTKNKNQEYNSCMVTKKLNKNKIRLHFVGIGGVSMSALAKLCVSRGYIVSGTDDNESATLEELSKLGVNIAIGSNREAIDLADRVIYTVAVGEHEDLVYAKSRKKPLVERASFLGEIASTFEHVIAISGTHGKSTMTAMVGLIFKRAKLKPTVHLGGNSPDLGGNMLIGKDKYFITEACEFNRSFLSLQPECCCITNIECDHMDTYSDYDDLYESFGTFATKTKKAIVFCGDCVNLKRQKNKKYISYGLDEKNKLCAKRIKEQNGRFSFDCYIEGNFLCRIRLNVVGKHNILNALGAIAIAHYYGVDKQIIIDALESFGGVDRRFMWLGQKNDVSHYADYAHHPTEIRALLDSLDLLKKDGKTVVIFQPHTYTRTKFLMREFVSVLSDCQNLILLPTYSAREKMLPGGDSTDLFFALPLKDNRLYCTNYYNLRANLNSILRPGDLCVWVGAGDIIDIAKYFLKDPSKTFL